MNLTELQKIIYENKIKQGFNVTDVPLEFAYTYGELGEAFEAWRKKQDDVGEELADVAIYLFGLAEILGYDLGQEIQNKVEKNAKRVYGTIDGVHKRISGE